MRKSNLLYMICLLFICNCGNERTRVDEDIDISKLWGNNAKTITLDEIGYSVRYIPLEVNEQSLFKMEADPNKCRTQLADSIIFVTDGTVLLSFDFEGNFLVKYGNQGRGPGEYIRVDNYSICEESKKVYIHSAANRKIISFSFDGSIIDETSLSMVPNAVFCYNGKFVCVSLRGWREVDAEGYAITILNQDGSVYKRLIDRREDKRKNHDGITGMVNVNYAGDNLYLFEADYSMLWIINKDFNIAGSRSVHFYQGREALESWVVNQRALQNYNFAEVKWIEYSVLTERYLFFQTYYGGRHYIVYDLNADNGYSYEIRNNFDEGPNFWPTGATSGGKLYKLVNGNHLISLSNMQDVSFNPDEWLLSRMKDPGFKDTYVLMLVTPK